MNIFGGFLVCFFIKKNIFVGLFFFSKLNGMCLRYMSREILTKRFDLDDQVFDAISWGVDVCKISRVGIHISPFHVITISKRGH